ncbi:MAG TPA: hypothetical protein VFU05_14805 [Cyclobacteriaceae bacterium]|nr:hypothetical protein [Cyclobacteriaceae bacterium]
MKRLQQLLNSKAWFFLVCLSLLINGKTSGQTDTTILMYNKIDFPQSDNSFTIPGVGTHEYHDFLFEIALNQDQQYASVKVTNLKGKRALIIKIDSVKEISKVHFYTESGKDIITFSAFYESIDRHNSGVAYVIERKNDTKIFSRTVSNSPSPILVNGFIIIMESLDLKLFDIKLTNLIKQYSVIHHDLVKNSSYLDSYGIAGLEYFKNKLFIEFSKNSFKSDFLTYCGSIDFNQSGNVIMLID